jgi:hypothetical protein
MTATFHLEDLGGDVASALPELVVGPWRRAPGLVAFDAGADRATSLWRIGLARDDDAGQRALAAGERSIAETHALLDDVPGRLDRAIEQAFTAQAREAAESPTWAPLASPVDPAAALPAGGHRIAEPARDATAAPAWARRALSTDPAAVRAAEARLIAALTSGAPRGLDRLAWSAAPAPAELEPEPGRLAQLLDRVADLARGRARIETRIAGALVAQSITTLSGDTELWAAPRLSLSGAHLHARSVAVAVRSRHAWARILTLTLRGASQLAVVGLPGGALSAVPLVWRFVRGVLRELRRRDAALRDAG